MAAPKGPSALWRQVHPRLVLVRLLGDTTATKSDEQFDAELAEIRARQSRPARMVN